jgi:hypothetical protein
MEWEEALLGSWGAETPAHPPAYYRRKAARGPGRAVQVTWGARNRKATEEAPEADCRNHMTRVRREPLREATAWINHLRLTARLEAHTTL